MLYLEGSGSGMCSRISGIRSFLLIEMVVVVLYDPELHSKLSLGSATLNVFILFGFLFIVTTLSWK